MYTLKIFVNLSKQYMCGPHVGTKKNTLKYTYTWLILLVLPSIVLILMLQLKALEQWRGSRIHFFQSKRNGCNRCNRFGYDSCKPGARSSVHRDIDNSAVNMVTSYIGSHQCQALVASSNLKFQCLIKRIDPWDQQSSFNEIKIELQTIASSHHLRWQEGFANPSVNVLLKSS